MYCFVWFEDGLFIVTGYGVCYASFLIAVRLFLTSVLYCIGVAMLLLSLLACSIMLLLLLDLVLLVMFV